MSTVIRMNVVKGIESMVRDGALSAIDFCGLKYGFDPEEAKREMMNNMKVSLRKKEVNIKKGVKGVKGVVLPWGHVREGCCNALRLNQGLYSQCMGVKMTEGELCKGCLKQCEKNDSGCPDYGMMSDRKGWEYVDAKGKSPVPYMKVMLKNGWTREVVEEEALLVGFEIDERHFEVPEAKKRGKKPSEKAPVTEEKKSRGRPKKESKVVEQGDNLEDLFAQLQLETTVAVAQVESEFVAVIVPEKKKGETEEERNIRKSAEKLAKQQAKSASSVPVQVPAQVEAPEPVQVEKKSSKKKSAAAVSDDSSTGSSTKSADKAAKKAAKDQEKMELAAKKEQEKVERELKKEQEKVERELKKEQEKAELAAKKEQEKMERELKKEQDRLEKEAKKEQDRLEKEQEKLAKKSSAKKAPVSVPEVPMVVSVPVITSAISSVSSEELEEESGSDSDSDSDSDSSSDSGSDSSSDEDESGEVKDLVEVKTLVGAGIKEPEVLAGADDDDDDMEETKEFKIDGVIYLRATKSNNVYTNDDENTHLGVWDPATKKLIPVVEQEESGDEEDQW